ncbi:DUF1311 domain-containing protein [Phragmitibacter flavus]|uniref:DUF1311 domain-containing protein n=1 Tax=Phragmitibacter flavus TaxID=2576071 RepID=A0A5R8KDL5_9BACT|nr:lysozyme inhibitor LprI family protein [Phragmitibacter flavus]TLD70394.1 DUF1311 domain-containing protein [Phragmitibacter flavus]
MSRLILPFILWFISLAISQAAITSSLDEAKARFAKADRELNATWAKAKSRLAESTFNDLKQIQRDWVIFRDQQAEVAAGEDTNPKTNATSLIAAAELTEERTKWLQSLLKNEGNTLAGFWIDGKGGTLSIVEKPDQLLFEFNVVRGESFDLGALSGIARWNSPIGWFSDQGRDADKPDETSIAFIHRGLYLEIITANADHYHGNRAHFDGRYFKATALSPEAQAVTSKAAETGKPSIE